MRTIVSGVRNLSGFQAVAIHSENLIRTIASDISINLNYRFRQISPAKQMTLWHMHCRQLIRNHSPTLDTPEREDRKYNETIRFRVESRKHKIENKNDRKKNNLFLQLRVMMVQEDH